MERMNVVFIINNRKNRLVNVLPALDRYCRQARLGNVQFIPTLRKKHAIDLAKQAAENGCDYLIAVGGDGTLHEVINGVLKSNIPLNECPAIGVLPFGSANDFARTAHLSNSIEQLVGLIQSRSVKRMDLGKIIIHQTLETRYFANIAGVGLGPEVVLSMEQSPVILAPGLKYFVHIVKGFLRYVRKEVKATGSQWQWKGRLLQMVVANGQYFGNALCVAPDAQLTDGLFQVAIFGDLSIWDYLKNLGNLKRGARISHPQVHYYNAREVLLESTDSCGIEADGEYVGLAPATISIIPRAVSFLMPADVR